MIFEIKIPIKGWEIAERRTFRLCVVGGSPGAKVSPSSKAVWPDAVYDFYTADFWAGGAVSDNPSITDPQVGSFPPPSMWGRATLSDVPPDEANGGGYWFYIAIVVVVIVSILVVVLLLKKLR